MVHGSGRYVFVAVYVAVPRARSYMRLDDERQWLKAVNIAQSNKLLRTAFLLVFDDFHPNSLLEQLPSGMRRFKSPPRHVTTKLGEIMTKVLGDRTLIAFYIVVIV